MSTPPKCSAMLSKAAAHRRRVGHVAGQRESSGAELPGLFARGGDIHIEQRDFGARRCEGLSRCRADCAAGAGDRDDLAGERQFLAGAELGLFERPIFAIEHLGLGNRLEAADRFGIADAFDPGLGDVGGDRRHRVLERPETEQSEPGHQHDAGQGIEFVFDAAGALVVPFEIIVVARDELADPLARGAVAKSPSLPVRRRQHQRPVLGADGVIRREDARRG